MAPVVHGLEAKYSEYLPFSFLDIDDPATQEIQEELAYNRSWRPYILLIDSNGEVFKIFVGVIAGEDIEIAIQQLLVKEGLLQ